MKSTDIIGGLAAAPLCEVCGRLLADGETTLCLHCRLKLDLLPHIITEETREHRLPFSVPVCNVYSLIAFYPETPLGQAVKRAKYLNRPDILQTLGEIFAHKLQAAGALQGVDCLMPLPMFWLKKLIRGYNQAEVLTDAMAKVTGLPVCRALRMVRPHSTQTRRNRNARLANAAGIFKVTNRQAVAGKHIALVDDILTTGATLSGAARTLAAAGAVKITVLPLCTVK